MIDKTHFKQLVEFAKVVLKYSGEMNDIKLYRISNNVYRGKILQNRHPDKVYFENLVVEARLEVESEMIVFTKDVLDHLKDAKVSTFDIDFVNENMIFSSDKEDHKDIVFGIDNWATYSLNENDRIIDFVDGDSFIYVDSISLPTIANNDDEIKIALEGNKAFICVTHKDSVQDDAVRQARAKDPTKKVKPTTPPYLIKTIGQATIITN